MFRENRELKCLMCGLPVYAEVRTTANPEAPEMYHIGAAWFGIVKGDAGPELYLLCSRPFQPSCVESFFSEKHTTERPQGD